MEMDKERGLLMPTTIIACLDRDHFDPIFMVGLTDFPLKSTNPFMNFSFEYFFINDQRQLNYNCIVMNMFDVILHC